MTEQYLRAIEIINSINQEDLDIGLLEEKAFINMIDAAGILYEAGRYPEPHAEANPLLSPRYDIKFTLVDEQGREHYIQVVFNWRHTVMQFNSSISK